MKKTKQDASKQLEEKVALDEEKKNLDKLAVEKELQRDRKLKTIGNYVHESVPVFQDEDHNAQQRTWAPEGVTVEKREGCLSHDEVLERLDGYDAPRGVKIAGHRGFFLKNYGYFLNRALKNHAENFLFKKGFTAAEPPFFMNKEYMAKTAQLEQFDEELYGVVGEKADADKYLIATSEQPISAMHANEWLTDKDLPMKYGGISKCFRKEAGSHGRDALGLFRTHQFDKVEQFIYIKPEDSWLAFDEMIGNAEEFYKSLELPYQVIAIVSGALNNAAAKKYDLEAWFPFHGEYKELVSCSNCTDYQSRELEIRYGQKKGEIDARKTYVHMLNCTLSATQRAMCCILENYQTPDGVNVPKVLQKYMPGEEVFLPYVKELPKNSTSQKAAPKPKTGGAPSGGPKLNPPSVDSVADKMKHMRTPSKS